MAEAPHFLCENCGYQLDGLPRSTNCPECGKPVEESHPDRRVGTAWQLRAGFGAWVKTVLLALRHPKAMWQRVRVESRRSTQLMFVNLAVGAGLASIGIAIPGKEFKPAGAVYSILFFVAAFDVLLLLTLIESVGIRTYGKRRKWRITRAAADAICGHASAGWTLSGVGVALGWHASQWADPSKVAAWIDGLFGAAYVPDYQALQWSILVVLVGGGLLAGLMVFEFLVYFGFRRMRYANPAEAGERAGETAL